MIASAKSRTQSMEQLLRPYEEEQKRLSKSKERVLFERQSSLACSEGRTIVVSLRGRAINPAVHGRVDPGNASRSWISGLLALPAAAYILTEQEAHAAELERIFITIKTDGVQRGLIAKIISRFERKGFKLMAIKIV
ncbi:nucleoside diphosphate kinase III, chloroplastic/mitochondrial-like, partial [Coffea eugenioides]|uniref:nucleoside diphosphate kinase III, chloroplastic/mitochondrial-like n=1 Tax=Coffea eugenioides TaxID=49369 RepID=UPI000F60E65B